MTYQDCFGDIAKLHDYVLVFFLFSILGFALSRMSHGRMTFIGETFLCGMRDVETLGGLHVRAWYGLHDC